MSEPNGHGQNGSRIYTTMEYANIQRKNGRLQGQTSDITDVRQYIEQYLLGTSEQIQKVRGIIEKIGHHKVTVLLTGETGTGKDLVTRVIHDISGRETFMPIDCPSIPKELQDAELFGYKKGSFTGSNHDRAGLLEVADNGTIFLNEIGELYITHQAALLDFLSTMEVRRIGENRRYKLDVRVIAATNKDLDTAVGEGSFRKDLYHRLAVVTIELPPLRERREDIPLLIQNFLTEVNKTYGVTAKFKPDEYYAYMNKYSWPGNIRQLRNLVERVVLLEEDPIAKLDELILKSQKRDVSTDNEIRPLHEVERKLILKAMETYGGNLTKTAEALGISRSTLYNRLNNYTISESKSTAQCDGTIDISKLTPGRLLEELKERVSIYAMQIAEGKITKAAALLGMSPRGLRHMLRRYRII